MYAPCLISWVLSKDSAVEPVGICSEGETLKGFKDPHVENLGYWMPLWSRVYCLSWIACLPMDWYVREKFKKNCVCFCELMYSWSLCYNSLACSLINSFVSLTPFSLSILFSFHLTWNFYSISFPWVYPSQFLQTKAFAEIFGLISLLLTVSTTACRQRP